MNPLNWKPPVVLSMVIVIVWPGLTRLLDKLILTGAGDVSGAPP
jgi:hypothetical protein